MHLRPGRATRGAVFVAIASLACLASCISFTAVTTSPAGADATTSETDGAADAGDERDAIDDDAAALDRDGGAADAARLPVDHGPCAGSLDCPRFVFVTSFRLSGNLRMNTGAGVLNQLDIECTELAASAGPPLAGRRYKVWLAALGENKSAGYRNLPGARPYILGDGTIVAQSWEAFAAGPHQHPIDRTEKGDVVTGAAWTATMADRSASYSGPDCEEWSSTNKQGRHGDISAVDGRWTDNGVIDCDDEARLYCVEE